MRQIQVLVPDDAREPVLEVLDDEEVDYVRQRAWVDGEEQWLLTFPVPTDAISHFLDRLDEAGVDVERYTVITSLEGAMTSRAEALLDRFATDFDPLTEPELRSKARDMAHDPRSFLALIAFSSIIATAGLLVESPAVVVGSMVIAPIVGPVLTAAVGAATGDREMLLRSVWLQIGGLVVAIVAAVAFGAVVQTLGFVPRTLDVTSIDLIAVRVAPGLLGVAVGLAAGAASAFGLATKGPTSVIGVMIAAALIPAAATAGIATVWWAPRIAVGSLLLLLLSISLINVGAYAVLVQLGYAPEGRWLRRPSTSTRRRLLAIGSTLLLFVLVTAIVAGSVQQITFERTVNQEVQATFASPEYDSVAPVTVRTQYGGVGPFASPETVTVAVSRTGGGEPPELAGELARRIRDATGHDVVVRVRFVEYQQSDAGETAADALGVRDAVTEPAVVAVPGALAAAGASAPGDIHTAPKASRAADDLTRPATARPSRELRSARSSPRRGAAGVGSPPGPQSA